MRQLAMNVVRCGLCRGRVVLALLVPLSLSPAPASAQDVFGFLRLFSSPPVARAPVYQPHGYRPLPVLARRTIRRRPKVVRADPPASKVPIKAKAPRRGDKPSP